MLTQSVDGYIRLTFDHFRRLPFRTPQAWEDDELCATLREYGIQASRAGYCEWADDITTPGISIGWAWFALERPSETYLAPGGFSSNIMFVADGYDLNPGNTNELITTWLSAQPWQHELTASGCALAPTPCQI